MESANQTKESKEKAIISKESKKEKPTLIEKIKELVNQKIDSGFELKDNKSVIELRKTITDELKINPNSRNMIRDVIKEVLVERKLQISDLGFKNEKIGDMKVNITKPDTNNTEPQLNTHQNIISSESTPTLPLDTTKGALPKPEQEYYITEDEEPEKQYMSESAQKKLISSALTKVIFPIYTAMGIVELDESEIKEEATLPKGKKVKAEFEELAGDIDEYLTENNIQLPAFLNHIAIMISIFVVLVLPVIKFKFFTTKAEPKPEYDKSADNFEVKT